MAKVDPEILAHLEWLGFVRPTGLVVSAPALVRAGAILGRRDAEGQQLLGNCAEERVFPGEKEPVEDPPRAGQAEARNQEDATGEGEEETPPQEAAAPHELVWYPSRMRFGYTVLQHGHPVFTGLGPRFQTATDARWEAEPPGPCRRPDGRSWRSRSARSRRGWSASTAAPSTSRGRPSLNEWQA
jgi:hypothetical protein